MRNSITMRYLYKPTRISKICVTEDVKQQKLSYTATSMPFRKLQVYQLTLNICISYDSTVLVLHMYSPQKYIRMNLVLFLEALFVEAKMCRLGIGYINRIYNDKQVWIADTYKNKNKFHNLLFLKKSQTQTHTYTHRHTHTDTYLV